jgi:hypothetical protein
MANKMIRKVKVTINGTSCSLPKVKSIAECEGMLIVGSFRRVVAQNSANSVWSWLPTKSVRIRSNAMRRSRFLECGPNKQKC